MNDFCVIKSQFGFLMADISLEYFNVIQTLKKFPNFTKARNMSRYSQSLPLAHLLREHLS
jgi:hypothetical protein